MISGKDVAQPVVNSWRGQAAPLPASSPILQEMTLWFYMPAHSGKIMESK
jgi:hypothetical protein